MPALPVGPSTPEAFTRTPIGEPLPQALQDRGDHILDTLQSLRGEAQLDFAWRTVLAGLREY